MNGLHKATAYFNNIEARKDWEAILQKAGNVNVFDIAKIAPKPEAGFRRIDKAIGRLRELIEAEAQLKVIAADNGCEAVVLDTTPSVEIAPWDVIADWQREAEAQAAEDADWYSQVAELRNG